MAIAKNKLLQTLITIILTFVSAPSFAAPVTSQTVFNDGTKAFNQGNYARAVDAFKKSESLGMKSPALYYNLASSYYMLGDYEEAGSYFEKVRSYSNMHTLADYNLGLIALKQGDKDTANNLFSSVAENSSDSKLITLAQMRLKESGYKKPSPWITKRWSVYLSALFGYDDNINFAPLGISNEISSSFSELVASGDLLLAGDRKNGWLATGYLYSIKYFNVDGPIDDLYDEYEYGAGIKKHLRINDWQTQYNLDANKSNYGGKDYQTTFRVGAEARKKLSRNERINLRYNYEHINSDNPLFNYLEGWRQKLRAEYRLYRKQDNSRLYYELELNDRNDLSTANGDFSYSPTRHTLRGRYTGKLSSQWHLTGDLAYRLSDYPSTANQNRQDERYKAAAYADYRFSKDVKLRGKVEYTDNRSSEDVFSYKRTVYTLGINALF